MHYTMFIQYLYRIIIILLLYSKSIKFVFHSIRSI